MTSDPPTKAAPDAEPAWTKPKLDNPHAEPDKARRVREMFAAIAPSYDLNNRVHSFGRDQAWRRAAVGMADVAGSDHVVDVACGTGDLSLAFADELNRQNHVARRAVLGIDFTYEMLPLAKAKAKAGTSGGRSGPAALDKEAAVFVRGDAMNLPLPDESVDILSIAFGIRNVADPAAALAEFFRVLRPGGRLIVLEFTVPTNPLVKLGYDFYCGWLMPRTATLISGDKSGAYKYLPRSVSTFTGKAELIAAMGAAGFEQVVTRGLTFGIATCYRGMKP